MNTVSIIIFSIYRAMQLDAVLRSFFYFCKDADCCQITVNYVITDENYRNRYNQVAVDFPTVNFHERTFLKTDIINMLKSSEYLIFMCDDILFYKDFYIMNIIDALRENPDTLGFLLRIGLNTKIIASESTDSFIANPPNKYNLLPNNIIKYEWGINLPPLDRTIIPSMDFHWCVDIVCSCYKSTHLLHFLEFNNIGSPWDIEWCFWNNTTKMNLPHLMCFRESVVTQCLLNRTDGRAYGPWSLEYLSELFDKGYRVFVPAYNGFMTYAACMNITLVFYKPSAPNIFDEQYHVINPGSFEDFEKKWELL